MAPFFISGAPDVVVVLSKIEASIYVIHHMKSEKIDVAMKFHLLGCCRLLRSVSGRPLRAGRAL
jgi:hypothetical protein